MFKYFFITVGIQENIKYNYLTAKCKTQHLKKKNKSSQELPPKKKNKYTGKTRPNNKVFPPNYSIYKYYNIKLSTKGKYDNNSNRTNPTSQNTRL